MRKRGRAFPKRVDPTAWMHAIRPSGQIDESIRTGQGIALHGSLELLRTNTAKPMSVIASAYNTIATAINISAMLYELGISDNQDGIERAQEALCRLEERGTARGVWAFDETGWQDIQHAAHVYDAQLAIATSKEVSDAIYKLRRRIG